MQPVISPQLKAREGAQDIPALFRARAAAQDLHVEVTGA
jgi:hypothetical protein